MLRYNTVLQACVYALRTSTCSCFVLILCFDSAQLKQADVDGFNCQQIMHSMCAGPDSMPQLTICNVFM